ncbi:RING finger and CHY zinc finger domain-containing protein 1-like [Onthophagus taurus]|uniref:RING finger and CHY zinc finger domain-containing protein 1-like n=1 Tax=Onthophagus taurus TaxID=166361 RepID=UPI000C20BA3B|nr:RING finger and CHY zinc finger domain-containing protein 1-like [Onthophagus taurus]
MAQSSIGCSHYKRRAMLLTPCCKKQYWCHYCHDAQENHRLVRKNVITIVCSNCNYPQEARNTCRKCHVIFATYFCQKCCLYDDTAKGQFHCDKCTICRVGGSQNFFHCDVCNMCLNIGIRETHKCIENSGRDGCTVCLEEIHSSRMDLTVPKCGHLIHTKCFESLKSVNITQCPTCRVELKSIM